MTQIESIDIHFMCIIWSSECLYNELYKQGFTGMPQAFLLCHMKTVIIPIETLIFKFWIDPDLNSQHASWKLIPHARLW